MATTLYESGSAVVGPNNVSSIDDQLGCLCLITHVVYSGVHPTDRHLHADSHLGDAYAAV